MEQTLSPGDVEEAKQNRVAALKLSNETIFILACAFLALLIRFFFIPQNTVINGDGIYYTMLGEKLAAGDIYGGISGYWSPLYSFLTGLASYFFAEREFAGRFVSLLAGALLIVPSYYLIRDFYGCLAARFGTILLIIQPLLIKASGWVMTESLYTLIFTTIVLSTWYALRNGRGRDFFLTGLLMGLAYLTKPEALGFLGLLLILTMGAKFFRPKIGFRRYAAGYLLILFGFTIFFLPYVIFLHQKTGQWTISQKIMINLPAIDYEGGLLKLTDDGQITTQDKIWGDMYETGNQPQEIAPKPSPPSVEERPSLLTSATILGEKGLILLKKQFRDYIPAIIPYFFVLIALVGFFYKPWTYFRSAKEIYLLSFFFCTLVGYALSTIELRYLFPVIPILIAWVAKGIIESGDWTSKSLSNLLRTSRPVNPRFVRIFILLVMAAWLVPLFLTQFKPDELENVPFEEKQAGLWIKNQTTQAPLVMSSHAAVAFYAGGKHLFIPDEEFSTVLEYARRKKVNYLVFSERRAKYSSAAFPLNEQNLPPELRLVYEDEPAPDYRIFVYQLNY